MKALTDRFALITGASQGLGRELALAYAREDVRGLALVPASGGAIRLAQLHSERISNVAATWRHCD